MSNWYEVLYHLFPATKATVRGGHIVIAHETCTSCVADFDRRFKLIEMALLLTYQGLLRLLGVQWETT